jgi:RHS repeat-associated protein
MTRNGTRKYLHCDDLGSARVVTDFSTNIVESYDYADYGQPSFFDGNGFSITNSVVGNPYLFTGRRFDPETRWYYSRLRYLDPTAGRFVTRDPTGLWADCINTGNGLTYVGNNPASRIDPLGLVSLIKHLYSSKGWENASTEHDQQLKRETQCDDCFWVAGAGLHERTYEAYVSGLENVEAQAEGICSKHKNCPHAKLCDASDVFPVYDPPRPEVNIGLAGAHIFVQILEEWKCVCANAAGNAWSFAWGQPVGLRAIAPAWPRWLGRNCPDFSAQASPQGGMIQVDPGFWNPGIPKPGTPGVTPWSP